jgi:ABC-type phosphate transport system ATPase subunit
MGNVAHSAIRESIHSVSYVCINRLMNFVNQNKIEVITGGQRGRICVAGASALPSQILIITLPATGYWYIGGWAQSNCGQ